MSKGYRYYMTHRPAGPGCQPKQGLIDIEYLDSNKTIESIGRGAWSVVTYDRKLTEQEVYSYELTPEVDE